MEDTGEISNSYYLAISEFDEYPVQTLFEVDGFYNPKFEIEVDKDKYIITSEYGSILERKVKKYKITLHKVVLI